MNNKTGKIVSIRLPPETFDLLKEKKPLSNPAIIIPENNTNVTPLFIELSTFFSKNISEIKDENKEDWITTWIIKLCELLPLELLKKTNFNKNRPTLKDLKENINKIIRDSEQLQNEIEIIFSDYNFYVAELLTFSESGSGFKELEEYEAKTQTLLDTISFFKNHLNRINKKIIVKRGSSKYPSYTKNIIVYLGEIFYHITKELPEIKINAGELSENKRYRFTRLYSNFIRKYSTIKWPKHQDVKKIIRERFSSIKKEK